MKRHRIRRANSRVPKAKFLIVCEGEKTEPHYFERKVESLASLSPESVVIKGTGKNTKSLVASALTYIEKQVERTGHKPDSTWLVFDRDSFSKRDVNEAYQIAKANGMKIAFSNEAFEVWYILHFEFLNTCISRTRYGRKLSTYFGKRYLKNDPNNFSILKSKGNENEAIKRAKRLENLHQGKSLTDSCPITTVYQLIVELNKFA